jgi:hypothetical protein
LDLVSLCISTFTHHTEGRRLARTRDAVKSDNLLAAEEAVIYRYTLVTVQFGVTIFCPNSQLRQDQHRIVAATLIAALHVPDYLTLHPHNFGGRIQRRCLQEITLMPQHFLCDEPKETSRYCPVYEPTLRKHDLLLDGERIAD